MRIPQAASSSSSVWNNFCDKDCLFFVCGERNIHIILTLNANIELEILWEHLRMVGLNSHLMKTKNTTQMPVSNAYPLNKSLEATSVMLYIFLEKVRNKLMAFNNGKLSRKRYRDSQ